MPEGVTDQGEDEKLGDALDGEFLVSVAHREQPPANPGNAHPEGAGRRRGQGGNIVGDGPLAEMAIALVASRDEGLHVSIGRKYPGRHSFGLRMIAGAGIVIHAYPLADECWPGTTWRSGSAGPMVSRPPHTRARRWPRRVRGRIRGTGGRWRRRGIRREGLRCGSLSRGRRPGGY